MATKQEAGQLRWLKNLENWTKACAEIHGGKYDYSLSAERIEVNGRKYVRIICPQHGEFKQTADKHKMGRGCPFCSGNKMHNPLDELRALYPNDHFPDGLFSSSKEMFALNCPEHGEFKVTYNRLMTRSKAGNTRACPKCNRINAGIKRRLGADNIRSRLKEAAPEYEFIVSDDAMAADKITCICKEHGEFKSKFMDIIYGSKCPKCALKTREKSVAEAVGVSPMQNVLDIYATHGGSIIPHFSTMSGTHTMAKFTCVKHGTFEAKLYSVKAGHGCPNCGHSTSRGERELKAWLDECEVDFKGQCRETLEYGELDVLIPSKSMAIEYCGLYWHGDNIRRKGYHLAKWKDAGKAGVRLITLFEDEWLNKKEIVKSLIRSMVVGGQKSIGARKTELRKISWAEAATFYEKNHLQGAGSPCGMNYGLFYNGELVSASSFKPSRFDDSDFELMRFASAIHVAGGMSKMLAAFAAEYGDGSKRLVSYCDLRWFSGKTYKAAGFNLIGQSAPGYHWCKGLRRYSRFEFQKHKLSEKLKDFDPNKTEEQNMIDNGFWKIWDCGMYKWEKLV